MAAPATGSNADLLCIVDRILRLTLNDQVTSTLSPAHVDQLQHRAQEATQTLALTDGAGGAVAAASPALCSLAVECVSVVDEAELTVGLARLVSAGCEVLAALLYPRLVGAVPAGEAGWDAAWVDETLEDLSDSLDFLALEVHCGLGRLESAITESDALPVVYDPCLDHFGFYWGSIEHRQALQDLSAWLMCVVFRAIGYRAVTARRLMEFANYDALCLCSLLRGLFNSCQSNVSDLPCDMAEIQSAALRALCGLAAPELAFPWCDGGSESIEEHNRTLSYYLEVLCAAMVETGLFYAALDVMLDSRHPTAGSSGAPFLSFLSTLLLQADGMQATPDDLHPPPLRLRAEVVRKADQLGSLLGDVLGAGLQSGAQLKELLGSCVTLSAAIATEGQQEGAGDGFLLSCRVLLSTSLEHGCGEGPEAAVILASLAALAANLQDFDISRERLAGLVAALRPEDRARALSRLTRRDGMRLLICGNSAPVLALFGEAGQDEAPVVAPPPVLPASQPPAGAPSAGLRDLVQNAPKEFRCALDGKLLCDPVVSPGNIVFERSALVRWLQKNGPVCPVTGQALQLEDCKRSPEIRKQVTEWVRGTGRPREPKKKKKNRR